ncbi:MAG: hypothetical protein J2P48_20585 [Alphaproteobacteria bacterium]|nr:hypothetical protein [Alphaproteobacteria bacterium]
MAERRIRDQRHCDHLIRKMRRADQAYPGGIVLLLGTPLDVVLAIVAFTVLPGSGAASFAAFSLVIA